MNAPETGGAPPWQTGVVILVFAASVLSCRSAIDTGRPPLPRWDVSRAEILSWRVADPEFNQDYALEASGLAAADGLLYVASEKYSRLLLMEAATDPVARVVELAVPAHAELEGVAVTQREVLLCDEAHAAVYLVPLRSLSRVAAVDAAPRGRRLPVRQLKLRGVSLRGGKIGFEGIEVDPRTGDILLLLERSRDPDDGCVSKIFRLRRTNDELVLSRRPIEVELDDCAWRLTGLGWWGNELIALRTQFPGERYEVVLVDLESGGAKVVLDLTEPLRSLGNEGWGNNVEGIAVTDDGALWLVSDNAVTGIIDDPRPPQTDELTLLLRIPLAED
jgi:uncharacterized protein YjiK